MNNKAYSELKEKIERLKKEHNLTILDLEHQADAVKNLRHKQRKSKIDANPLKYIEYIMKVPRAEIKKIEFGDIPTIEVRANYHYIIEWSDKDGDIVVKPNIHRNDGGKDDKFKSELEHAISLFFA